MNVVGSFVLGVVAASGPDAGLVTLVGTGFCGALTTFSTFGYETVRLTEEGETAAAVSTSSAASSSGSPLPSAWAGRSAPLSERGA